MPDICQIGKWRGRTRSVRAHPLRGAVWNFRYREVRTLHFTLTAVRPALSILTHSVHDLSDADRGVGQAAERTAIRGPNAAQSKSPLLQAHSALTILVNRARMKNSFPR